MRKSEIERSYHQGTRGLPMVNVKQDRWYLTAEEIGWLRGEFPFLPADDTLARELIDDAVEGHEWVVDAAREQGWDDLRSDAEEIFGTVRVYSAGRSDGWAAVEGLPDVDEWDAIMVAKWSRFAKWARQEADNVVYQAAWLVCANVLESKYEAKLAEEAEDAAALLPIGLVV